MYTLPNAAIVEFVFNIIMAIIYIGPVLAVAAWGVSFNQRSNAAKQKQQAEEQETDVLDEFLSKEQQDKLLQDVVTQMRIASKQYADPIDYQ